jgi:hypothetical protein
MADIPPSDTLNNLTDTCKGVYHEDRWYNKYSKGGQAWCSTQPAHCDPDDKYVPSNDINRGQAEGCGCKSGACTCLGSPGNKCAWAKYHDKHESERCLAKTNVYPTDDDALLKCCSGDTKEIDCHPSFCVSSKPCNQFMQKYCFQDHQDQFFGDACTKWIKKGYVSRNNVLDWANYACNQVLNNNNNPTKNPKFIDWCKANIKANPGKFDQVMNRFCTNSKNITDPMCSCYGVIPIPGASQAVPKMCLGECNKTGYLSNQMQLGKCAITICNTSLQVDNNENTSINIDQLVQKCEATVGDAKVSAGDTNIDTDQNINVGVKSIFPKKIVNIAVNAGLNKIAKQFNISLDILLFIIIFAILSIILFSNDENMKPQLQQTNYSGMPPPQYIYAMPPQQPFNMPNNFNYQ